MGEWHSLGEPSGQQYAPGGFVGGPYMIRWRGAILLENSPFKHWLYFQSAQLWKLFHIFLTLAYETYLPHFIPKRAIHFLRKCSDLHLPDDSFLNCRDVTSVYKNIQRNDGINSTVNEPRINSNMIFLILRMVLKLVNFEFNSSHYVQIILAPKGIRLRKLR